jgi:glycyl-tRNA synthetase beta chain
MADLVFEIGTEELPASFQRPAVDYMEAALRKELEALGLSAGKTQAFATPRRLTVVATGLTERSADQRKTVQGPPAKAAFQDGKPTKAAEGFARKIGVSVDALKVEGDRVVVDQLVKGTSAAEALPQILGRIVSTIPFKKSMRWGDLDVAFARPVHWIGAALDGKRLDLTFGDVKSGTSTRGHRFAAPAEFPLPKAADYAAALREAHVLADWDARKQAVWREVERGAKEAGGEPLPDEDLLETVTGLVEEPFGVYGKFEATFLDLPPEVLVSEMRGHQKYFAVQDASSKKLMPAFVAISNTKVADPAVSRRGYERVLRARLSDARFFYDEDRKQKLSARNERLARTVFLQGLGSQWDRVQRIERLALALHERLGVSAPDAIKLASQVLKSDLATGMVGEFPDLQGVMGREYAKEEGLPADVADAIFEHYLPRGAEDRMPQGDLGALLGLSDRLDQLAGIFGIGKEPTGTADPYGLRRAAVGAIRLVLHKKWRLDLRAALQQAAGAFAKGRPETAERVWQFLLGRLQSFFADDFSTFEIQMALGRASGDLLDVRARLEALRKLRGSKELQTAAAAFKRIENILQQARAKGLVAMHFDRQLLADESERALGDTYEKARGRLGEVIKAGNYGAAFELLAGLSAPLASFFDDVMVMAPDAKVRDNRLALLRQLHELFAPLADFSKLQVERE